MVLRAGDGMQCSEPAPPRLAQLSPCPHAYLALQLYEVGDKRELLVTVQLEDPSNPDSTVTVDMTTTLPEGGEPPPCAACWE